MGDEVAKLGSGKSEVKRGNRLNCHKLRGIIVKQPLQSPICLIYCMKSRLALLAAMFYLWERLKLIVEPTGALGAAAAFEGRIPITGRRVGVILTGGNVDLSQVSQWLAQR